MSSISRSVLLQYGTSVSMATKYDRSNTAEPPSARSCSDTTRKHFRIAGTSASCFETTPISAGTRPSHDPAHRHGKIAVCPSGEPGRACRQVRGRVHNPTRIRDQQEHIRVQQTPSPDALPATYWCAGSHSGGPEVLRRPETPQHNPLSKHIRVRPPHGPKPRCVDPGNFAETNHAVSRRDDRTLSLVSTRRNVVVAPGSRLRPRNSNFPVPSTRVTGSARRGLSTYRYKPQR